MKLLKSSLLVLISFSFCAFLNAQSTTQFPISFVSDTLVTCQGKTLVHNTTGGFVQYSYSFSIESSPIDAGFVVNDSSGALQPYVHIRWDSVGTHTLMIAGSDTFGGDTAYQVVIVNPAPQANILASFAGACFRYKPTLDGGGQDYTNTIGDSCLIVCDSTIVRYYSNSPGDTFNWTISGGTIVTTYGIGDSIDVFWPDTGGGSLSLEVITTGGCVSRDSICVEIIKKPNARFVFDSEDSLATTINICKGQSVTVTDRSTGDSLTTWEWSFGDGTGLVYGGPFQSVTHTYNSPGVYTIRIRVINTCGCSDTFTRQVIVDESPGLEILCASAVCADDTSEYYTPINCSNYYWSVTGGSIIGSANSQVIKVYWNGFANNGFGTVRLDSTDCDSVCSISTSVSIPILNDGANMTNPDSFVVCRGAQSFFSIPNWPGTTFNWEVGTYNPGNQTISPVSGVSVVSGQGTHSVVVEFRNTDTTVVNFRIRATYNNPVTGCNGIIERNVFVRPRISVQGTEELCLGDVGFFSNNLGISVNWQIIDPAGNDINPGSFTDSLTFTFDSIPGIYQVIGSRTNYCQGGNLLVNVIAPPSPLSIFTGDTLVCTGVPYTYSATPDTAGVILEWESVGGNPSNVVGPNASIVWDSLPASLYVWQVSAKEPHCKSDTLIIPIRSAIPDSMPIIGPDTVCANSYSNYHTTFFNADEYRWEISPKRFGSVSAGFLNDSVEILWNNTSVPVDVEMILEARKCGTTLYDTFQVHIVPVILPYITAPDTVCQNDIVQLFESDSTIIEGSAWLWDLPGNDASTQPNPTYQFDSAGVFNLILAVTDPFGCGGTFSANHQIVVNPLPVGVLSSPTGNTLCLPDTSTLNVAIQQAGAYRYDWYQSGQPPTLIAFDGGTSQNVADTGFYFVSIFDSATGCSNETNFFLLNCDTVGGDSCNLNPILTLTDSLIYPTCGTIVLEGHSNLTVISDELIVFENGVANQFSQNPLQYSFDASGFYAVDYRATVTDGVDTCTVTENFVVEVPIFARFDHGISCGPAGQYTIDLRDLSDYVGSNQINSWSWELNGSPVSSNRNPSVNVTGGSTAIFTQRVSDGVNTCEVSDTISIPTRPQADFYWSIDTPCENTTVFFRDTSSGNIASWYWDFGDTSSNLNQHPEKVYRDPELIPGFFLPQLIVTDLYGCQDTAVDSLVWAPNQFTGGDVFFNQPGNCSSLGIRLDARPNFSIDPNLNYQWNNGSSQYWTMANNPGAFLVTVTDQYQCDIVIGPQSVNFFQPPSAIIDGPNSICSNEPVSFFGFAGSSLIYQWHLNGNPYGGNDPVLSFPPNGLPPGSNDVQLIVGQAYPPTDTCWDTSVVHTFQVYSPPSSPTLSSNTLSCDPYEVRLTSDVPVVWIPGAQIPSMNTFVSNPGTYEAVHTDTNGCSSQWNITVGGPPQVQSLLSGCYSICDTALPLLIGNITGNVDSFAFFMNDSLIQSGSGVPGNLYIYGAGRFTYWAFNQGCSVWSDTLEVDVSPCSPCTGNISLGSITCDSGGTYTVKFDVDSFALGPNYYFDFESPGRTFTNVSPSNPVNITGLPFTIIATLDPGSNSSPGTSFIVDFDVYRPDYDTCNLQVEVIIPECPDSICEVEGEFFYPDSTQCYLSDSTGLPQYELRFNPGNSIPGLLILYSDQGTVFYSPYVSGSGANVSLGFSDTGAIDSIICFTGYVVNSDNQDSCLIDTCVEVTPCLDELDPCSNLEVGSTALICLDSVGDGSSVVSYVLDIDYSGSSQSYYEISNSSGGDLIHISDSTLNFGSNLIYGQFINRSDTSHLCLSLVIYDPVAEDTCLFDTCLVLDCEPIDTCEIENPEVQILCADTSGGIQEYFVTVRFNWPGQTPPFFASAVQSGTWTLLGNQSLQIQPGLNEWNGRYVHTTGSNFFFEILTYDPSTGYPCEIYFEQELPTEDNCSDIPACGIKVDDLDIICVQPDSANGDLYRFVLDIGTTSGNFGPAPYYLVPNNGAITGVSSSAIWFTGGGGGATHVDLISGEFRDVNNTGDLSFRLIIFDTANGTSCMFEITEGLPDCNDSLTTCENDTATFDRISCEGTSNGIGVSGFRLTIDGLDGITNTPLVYALNGNSLNVGGTGGSSTSRIRFRGVYFDLPAYDDSLCMVVVELDVDGNPTCFDTFCFANPCSQSAKMAFGGGTENEPERGITADVLQMDLYPNPNKGQFTVSLNESLLDQTTSIQIFDLTGKLVSSKQIGESLSGLFHLDIAGYSSGMYLVVCVSEEGRFLKTSRAIIQQ